MALTRLLKLVPPPAKPAANSGDWNAVTAAVGHAMPKDYRKFVETYGIGELGNFIRVLVPFGKEDLPSQMAPIRDAYRDLWSGGGSDIDAASLVPFATNTNGGALCFVKKGADPETWAIAALSSDGTEETTDVFEKSMGDFLADWLSKKVDPRAFPAEEVFPDGVEKTFTSRPGWA